MTDDQASKIHEELKRASDLLTRASEKFDRLASVVSGSTDRQIVIADRLEKQIASTDRITDATLLVRQRLTEIYEQREYIRTGLDQLRSELATHFALVKNELDDVDKDLDRIRESSGKFVTLSPEVVQKEAEDRAAAVRIKAEAEAKAIETTAAAEADAIKRDPWLSRVFIVIFKGSTRAQVTAIVLAIIAAVALVLGGASTIKQLFPQWFTPSAAPAAAKTAEKGAETHADDKP